MTLKEKFLTDILGGGVAVNLLHLHYYWYVAIDNTLSFGEGGRQLKPQVTFTSCATEERACL